LDAVVITLYATEETTRPFDPASRYMLDRDEFLNLVKARTRSHDRPEGAPIFAVSSPSWEGAPTWLQERLGVSRKQYDDWNRQYECWLEMRGVIDNFAQIDFGRPDHHQALVAAANRAVLWTAEPQGRPKRDHLNDFFDGATELFQQVPNADLKVSNHHDARPHTPFEAVLYAGHRIIDLNVSYHATVKAFHRR
jgi:hypothetical protein